MSSNSQEHIASSAISTDMSLTRCPFHVLTIAGSVCLALGGEVDASTIWNGPVTNYTQPAPHDGSTAAQQDHITSDCWLTRGTRLPMYNVAPPYDESGFSVGGVSPANTEWAFGTLDDLSGGSLTFDTWENTIGGGEGDGFLQASLPNQPLVMHIISDDIYLSIEFSSWSQGGGYSYSRSTPAAVVPPTPTVTLTNPAAGVVLAAPATLHLGASASVSSGTVTNVTFFASTGGAPASVGSVTTSPFNVNSSSLAAGSYALTAVATAVGVSATSAPVNISVVTPVAVSNSAPAVSSQHFRFNFAANPGLTYVVQRSTNLINWTPILTNVPSVSSAPFTDSAAVGSNGFYRVVRQANP
jgi:hypothetical protein